MSAMSTVPLAIGAVALSGSLFVLSLVVLLVAVPGGARGVSPDRVATPYATPYDTQTFTPTSVPAPAVPH